MPDFYKLVTRRLEDPWRSSTRRERALLLVFSAVSLIMVYGGLVPTKITAFGIEFSALDQRNLLLIVATVVGYFLVSFGVHAFVDLAAFKARFQDYLHDTIERRHRIDRSQREAQREEEALREDIIEMIREDSRAFLRASPLLYRVQLLLDFAFPLVLGSDAVVQAVLLAARLSSETPMSTG